MSTRVKIQYVGHARIFIFDAPLSLCSLPELEALLRGESFNLRA